MSADQVAKFSVGDVVRLKGLTGGPSKLLVAAVFPEEIGHPETVNVVWFVDGGALHVAAMDVRTLEPVS